MEMTNSRHKIRNVANDFLCLLTAIVVRFQIRLSFSCSEDLKMALPCFCWAIQQLPYRYGTVR